MFYNLLLLFIIYYILSIYLTIISSLYNPLCSARRQRCCSAARPKSSIFILSTSRTRSRSWAPAECSRSAARTTLRRSLSIRSRRALKGASTSYAFREHVSHSTFYFVVQREPYFTYQLRLYTRIWNIRVCILTSRHLRVCYDYHFWNTNTVIYCLIYIVVSQKRCLRQCRGLVHCDQECGGSGSESRFVLFFLWGVSIRIFSAYIWN